MTAYEFALSSGGLSLPQDNGYLLLSALSVKFPFLHGNPDIQIAPVRGTRTPDNRVKLDTHSRLHIRGLTAEQARVMSGSWVIVQGAFLGLGEARQKDLTPSTYLVSRLVVFKEVVAEEAFREAIAKELPQEVTVTLGEQRGVHIKGKVLLGRTVHLNGLDPVTAQRVLQKGLGKFTSMGCGVFYPGNRAKAA